MKSVSPETYRLAHATGAVARIGGKRVNRNVPQMSGFSRDGGHTLADVTEFATPGGEVVARKVCALGEVACWVRRDLAEVADAEAARSAAEAQRVIGEVLDYAHASRQHSRDQMAETYVLSSALLHAAARRQAKLGGLYDMNAHGDKVRGNLVAALERAKKAEKAK